MGVLKTNLLLKEFIKKRKKSSPKQYLYLQQELLIEPVAQCFEQLVAPQLHKYLLDNGLFFPDAKILTEVQLLEKNNVWQHVETHYQKLKKAWGGKEADIFIFPVERRNDMIMKELKGKMGISFHDVIILFLSKQLSSQEIKALFTHEYNHVCRLFYLGKQFEELTLLDSMIIEGMAEIAVENVVGKEMLAPWVNLYSKEELLPYWNKAKKQLSLKGKDKHDLILYGDKRRNTYPKWFGYCIGHMIVKGFLESNQQMEMKQLLQIESMKILKQSGFDPDIK